MVAKLQFWDFVGFPHPVFSPPSLALIPTPLYSPFSLLLLRSGSPVSHQKGMGET